MEILDLTKLWITKTWTKWIKSSTHVHSAHARYSEQVPRLSIPTDSVGRHFPYIVPIWPAETARERMSSPEQCSPAPQRAVSFSCSLRRDSSSLTQAVAVTAIFYLFSHSRNESPPKQAFIKVPFCRHRHRCTRPRPRPPRRSYARPNPHRSSFGWIPAQQRPRALRLSMPPRTPPRLWPRTPHLPPRADIPANPAAEARHHGLGQMFRGYRGLCGDRWGGGLHGSARVATNAAPPPTVAVAGSVATSCRRSATLDRDQPSRTGCKARVLSAYTLENA